MASALLLVGIWYFWATGNNTGPIRETEVLNAAFLPRILAIILMAIGLGITILALPIVYFRLAGQTSGDLKKNSLTIAFGYLFTFIMVLTHMMVGSEDAIPFGWIIFLIGNFIGAMILLGGYLKSTY